MTWLWFRLKEDYKTLKDEEIRGYHYRADIIRKGAPILVDYDSKSAKDGEVKAIFKFASVPVKNHHAKAWWHVSHAAQLLSGF